MTDQEDEIIQGRRLNPTDEMLVQMARDSFKNSAPALTDTLSKLLTLDTAVFGAGIAAAVGFKDAVPFWGLLGALGLVLASIMATLAGLYPRKWVVEINELNSVTRMETGVIDVKAWYLKLAYLCLVAALATAIGCVAWTRI